MKIEIQFTQDYAVNKKGDKKLFSHQLGTELIRLGVAEKVGVEVITRKIEPINPPKNKVEKAPKNK